MKIRNILYADEGKILTNGTVYGRIVYLPENETADIYYEIPQEEYEEYFPEEILEEQTNMENIEENTDISNDTEKLPETEGEILL